MQNFGETTKNNIIVPREIENNSYAKFWRDNKEYYDIFEKGLLLVGNQFVTDKTV